MKITKYITIILLLLIASQSYANKLKYFNDIMHAKDVTPYINKVATLSPQDMKLQVVQVTDHELQLSTSVYYNQGKNIIITGIAKNNRVYTVNQTLDLGKNFFLLQFLGIRSLKNSNGYIQVYIFKVISMNQYNKIIS
tara:strand:- start:2809 stop:3222 length:414 start_codon:yes stop_codon:yes gene_type:complete